MDLFNWIRMDQNARSYSSDSRAPALQLFGFGLADKHRAGEDIHNGMA